MTEIFLVKLFEHNNWANNQIIETCYALSEEQLDIEPQSVTKGTIRRTLVHLVSSQESYLGTLTLPLEERLQPRTVPFEELKESAESAAKDYWQSPATNKSHRETDSKQGMGSLPSPGLSCFRSSTMPRNIASRSKACSVLWG